MHTKYHELLDPVFLQYALNVEATSSSEPLSWAQQREHYNQNCNKHHAKVYDSIEVHQHALQGRNGNLIPIRSYTPPSIDNGPVTVYLHGGGWVLGNLDSHDDICMDICLRTESTVVAVEYRLAPEHPFPCALHDCIDTLLTLLKNELAIPYPMESLVLSGDSAGANLSVSSCLSKEFNTKLIKGLVLIYPGLGADDKLPSFKINEFAPILPKQALEAFFKAYLGGDISRANYLTSPLLAESYSDLPPCYISAAEHDPLRDDAIEFCRRLDKQHIHCQLTIEDDLGHGYLRVRHESDSANSAFEACCYAITAMHQNTFPQG